jgi:hypothetical protein
MADIPTSEPASARAGDTWRWTRSLTDYPAGTWTLKYRFRNATLAGFEIVAGASGTDHDVNVAAATSAGYGAGTYTWTAWVEGGTSEKYTVGGGTMEVEPDYRAAAAGAMLDDRTHAKKMLDSIEAWLESKDPAVAEYEIAGRRMKYIPIGELMQLRIRYRQEVAAQEAAKKLARGQGVGRRIQFRV